MPTTDELIAAFEVVGWPEWEDTGQKSKMEYKAPYPVDPPSWVIWDDDDGILHYLSDHEAHCIAEHHLREQCWKQWKMEAQRRSNGKFAPARQSDGYWYELTCDGWELGTWRGVTTYPTPLDALCAGVAAMVAEHQSPNVSDNGGSGAQVNP